MCVFIGYIGTYICAPRTRMLRRIDARWGRGVGNGFDEKCTAQQHTA